MKSTPHNLCKKLAVILALSVSVSSPAFADETRVLIYRGGKSEFVEEPGTRGKWIMKPQKPNLEATEPVRASGGAGRSAARNEVQKQFGELEKRAVATVYTKSDIDSILKDLEATHASMKVALKDEVTARRNTDNRVQSLERNRARADTVNRVNKRIDDALLEISEALSEIPDLVLDDLAFKQEIRSAVDQSATIKSLREENDALNVQVTEMMRRLATLEQQLARQDDDNGGDVEDGNDDTSSDGE